MEIDEPSDSEKQALLSKNINNLPIKIESTYLDGLIFQLYHEMEMAGILFKPPTYLSDIWGCPNEVPSIGIPFYLADPMLYRLYHHMTRSGSEDDNVNMQILRHEAGHAFNYAYRLYDHPEWQDLFGSFSLPYQDYYTPDPLSTRFVRHIAGCYSQKHPDDDFAETFAVWLTPFSNCKKTYAGTPAFAKLLYVDRMVSGFGRSVPIVTGGKLDMPFEEMNMTLGEWVMLAA